jgi:Ca-activated chloride channel homolog
MSFLNPTALFFLLGIPAVIILHLLKIRRRQALVSSTLLWTDSLRDQQASAPFRRLKPNLLLLLQILAILLLALALARPVRTVLLPGYARTVFIVDVSASMQATDVPGSRFAAAKEAALAAASTLGNGQQAMLIAAGHEAQVVVPFTDDPSAIRRGLAGLTALDVPGRLSDALRLAQANLQFQGGTAAVEVFTDGAFDPPRLPDLGGAAVHWHRFGQRGTNVGITAFEARKTFFGAFDYQAFLSVANYGSEPASFDIALTMDGRRIKAERVTLTPELKRSFVFPFLDREGGVLKAEISLSDDLLADNQALAVLPPPRPLRVLLVSPGNPFLEKALAADAQVHVTRGGWSFWRGNPSTTWRFSTASRPRGSRRAAISS